MPGSWYFLSLFSSKNLPVQISEIFCQTSQEFTFGIYFFWSVSLCLCYFSCQKCLPPALLCPYFKILDLGIRPVYWLFLWHLPLHLAVYFLFIFIFVLFKVSLLPVISLPFSHILYIIFMYCGEYLSNNAHRVRYLIFFFTFIYTFFGI